MKVNNLSPVNIALLRDAIQKGKRVLRILNHVAIFTINRSLLRKVLDEKESRKKRTN